MGVLQRHNVVDVQFAGVGHDAVGVGRQPLAGSDSTSSVAPVGNRDPAFGNQGLVTGVLAIIGGQWSMFCSTHGGAFR